MSDYVIVVAPSLTTKTPQAITGTGTGGTPPPTTGQLWPRGNA